MKRGFRTMASQRYLYGAVREVAVGAPTLGVCSTLPE
jgi:hypothetical protein